MQWVGKSVNDTITQQLETALDRTKNNTVRAAVGSDIVRELAGRDSQQAAAAAVEQNPPNVSEAVSLLAPALEAGATEIAQNVAIVHLAIIDNVPNVEGFKTWLSEYKMDEGPLKSRVPVLTKLFQMHLARNNPQAGTSIYNAAQKIVAKNVGSYSDLFNTEAGISLQNNALVKIMAMRGIDDVEKAEKWLAKPEVNITPTAQPERYAQIIKLVAENRDRGSQDTTAVLKTQAAALVTDSVSKLAGDLVDRTVAAIPDADAQATAMLYTSFIVHLAAVQGCKTVPDFKAWLEQNGIPVDNHIVAVFLANTNTGAFTKQTAALRAANEIVSQKITKTWHAVLLRGGLAYASFTALHLAAYAARRQIAAHYDAWSAGKH